MKLTVVNVDEAKLWNDALVKNLRTGVIKKVFVVPEDKTLFQCVKEGLFTAEHVDYSNVMLNKHLFELVKEEETGEINLNSVLDEALETPLINVPPSDVKYSAALYMFFVMAQKLNQNHNAMAIALSDLLTQYKLDATRVAESLGSTFERISEYGLPAYKNAVKCLEEFKKLANKYK